MKFEVSTKINSSAPTEEILAALVTAFKKIAREVGTPKSNPSFARLA